MTPDPPAAVDKLARPGAMLPSTPNDATERPVDDVTVARCQVSARWARIALFNQLASPVNCTRTIGLWAMAAANDTALR